MTETGSNVYKAVQLVLLSVVTLTCLQTGVTHECDDDKSLCFNSSTCMLQLILHAFVHVQV